MRRVVVHYSSSSITKFKAALSTHGKQVLSTTISKGLSKEFELKSC